MAVFLAVQFVRTRHVREQFRSIAEQLRDRLKRDARNEQELKAVEDYAKVPDDNDLAVQGALLATDGARKFVPHFLNKVWVLIRTGDNDPFQIGDHPLVLQNMNDFGTYGNLGLGVRGIEIYFPLSPTRGLALWCPTLVEKFRKATEDLDLVERMAPDRLQELRNASSIKETWAAINDGVPLMYKRENVENFNYLQIRFAERYVMSSIEDFALARRMIADDPKIRSGLRAEVR